MELKDEIDGMIGAIDSNNQNIDTIGAAGSVIGTGTGSGGGDASTTAAGDAGAASAAETDVEALRRQFADSVSTTPDILAAAVNPLDKFKEDIEFMKKADLDGLADNPALLNIAFNQVRRQTAEALLEAFPQLINQAMQAHQVKKDIHDTFYTEHKELTPYKNFVVNIAKEVGERMKDKPANEVLAEIAKSAKERLKLPTMAIVPPTSGVKPALRDSKGSARTGSQQSSGGGTAQTQIADMLGL